MTYYNSQKLNDHENFRLLQQTQNLAQVYGHLDGVDLLKPIMLDVFPYQIAVSSSFGVESAALLHMVAQIDPGTPVVFIDTGKLFTETLAYKDRLVDHLGLTNIRVIQPSAFNIIRFDPQNDLFQRDHDTCCAVRKVSPFEAAVEEYSVLITGRKRYQSNTRRQIAVIEQDNKRIEINPVARWSMANIQKYMEKNGLPAHPLIEQGYLSIGCAPCTSPVRESEDPRAGRWRGSEKTECGIHH